MKSIDRRWVLVLLGVLLAVNLVIFFSYRVRQQERIGSLRDQREALESQLETAREDQRRTAEQVVAVGQLEQELDRIFNETWGEPDDRLTPLLRDLYAHASKSGLQPSSRSYGNEQASREGEATAMTISFGVNGSYAQLRRMISLIEGSDQYVVIDSLGLSESTTGNDLQINLQLRTLFREELREMPRPVASAGGDS